MNLFFYVIILIQIKQQLEIVRNVHVSKQVSTKTGRRTLLVRAYKQHEFLIVFQAQQYLLRYRCLTKTKGA